MELFNYILTPLLCLALPLLVIALIKDFRKGEKKDLARILHEEIAPLTDAKEAEARYQKCLADQAIKRNGEENNGISETDRTSG